MRRAIAAMTLAACGEGDVVAAEPDACGETQARMVATASGSESIMRIERTASRVVMQTTNGLFARLVSVDRCGGDATTADRWLAYASPDSDRVLVCTQGNVHVLDERLDMVQDTLLSGVECELAVVGDLVLARRTADDAIVAVALGDRLGRVVATSLAEGALDSVSVMGEQLVALGTDGVVRFIEIETAEVVAEHAGVAAMSVSPDGSAMLVQRGVPAEADVPGRVEWIDLASGDAVALLDTSLTWSPQPWFHDMALLTDAPGRPWKVFRGGRQVALPEGTALRGVAPDGRLWITATAATPGSLLERLWDPGTLQASVLYHGEGYASGGPDGIDVLVPSVDAGIQRGSLWSVPWSGGDPRLVGDDVGWHRARLPDGRWLSVAPVDGGQYGPLLLHEAGSESIALHPYAHDGAPLHAAHAAAGTDALWYATLGAIVRAPIPAAQSR